jgi:hypothetical protein
MKYEHIRTYRQRSDVDGRQAIQATTKMEIIHYLLDEIEELRQYIETNERKPLTDEEILTYRHMLDWTAEWSYINFARAIERAHGIGGEE